MFEVPRSSKVCAREVTVRVRECACVRLYVCVCLREHESWERERERDPVNQKRVFNCRPLWVQLSFSNLLRQSIFSVILKTLLLFSNWKKFEPKPKLERKKQKKKDRKFWSQVFRFVLHLRVELERVVAGLRSLSTCSTSNLSRENRNSPKQGKLFRNSSSHPKVDDPSFFCELVKTF